jgi:L-ascorbate metabolism protein UlaG (beta-lactamase superfamily)
VIEPALRDAAFLADVEAARDRGPCLWWLGQSGFLLQWEGRRALLDPYLSESLTVKYAGTERPHVRMTARVVAPEDLTGIDLVTSTHAHTDHFDGGTLRPVLERNPAARLVLPAAQIALAAERAGCATERLVPLDDGGEDEIAGFRVTAVPAAHEEVERDEAGRCRFLGYVLRFGPWSLYHSGDTVRYRGLARRLRPFRPDVALLPINGRDPARGVPGNLDGPEAAALARDIGARLVIPCHYEMFTFNTASPEPFRVAAARLGQPCRVLRAGERWCAGDPREGGRTPAAGGAAWA